MTKTDAMKAFFFGLLICSSWAQASSPREPSLREHSLRGSASERLFEAATRGDMKTIEAHKDLTVKNSSGETLLITAASSGHEKLVSWLLAKGLNPNEVDDGGGTALFYAVSAGEEKIAKLLVDKGTDLQKKYGVDEEVISFELARLGMTDLLKQVLAKNPTLLKQRNKKGNTALHESVLAAQSRSAAALLAAGLDRKIKNKKNQTAMDLIQSSDKDLKKVFAGP